jgi:hypothetical protein
VPIEACAYFGESLKALKKARLSHWEGRYDDAVRQCRDALAAVLEKNVGGKGKRLKERWEATMGTTTYNWLRSAIRTVNDRTNDAHHPPVPHFDQLESQMLLAVTTAFVAYVARTAANEEGSAEGA